MDVGSVRSKERRLRYRIKTGFLFILSVLDGLVDSSYGPTVMDYQCLFQETRQRVSLLYPVFATFKAIGNLVYFFMHRRLDPYFTATVCMIITCVLLVSLPQLPVFWLALLVTAIIGLASGIASHARLAETGILAEENPVPIHLFPLALCTGSITGFLVISPFLKERGDAYDNNGQNISNRERTSTFRNNSDVTLCTEQDCYGFQSNIVYGFITFAVLGGVVFLGYIPLNKLLMTDKCKYTHIEEGASKSISKIDFIFLLILATMVLIAGSTNFVYGNLLSTFGINASLKISPWLMSLMTSSFYALTFIGRIVGTFVSFIVSQRTLLTVCLIGSVVAAVGLVFVAEISIISLWLSSSVFAFIYAPMFGATIAWSADVCRYKHLLYGVIIIADYVGFSLMSFLFSQLVNNVAMEFLNFCMLGVSVTQALLFVLLYMTFKLVS